ncbi:tetratricopeptide repeat protein [Trichocoleus sp. FACHB-591]|uniref:tetratricopeptide repeat protein n=1 Tax=Trichocoleus sp. FACHB-591 TaxID=2692872 RepID=UPI001686F756|nr:tetratricopeptide repeat protein [Trichocoleus sp. FACHB-591]MBD2096273.1 tetratricopeptide repeat protein [Trichocoleus sp. FACHB-591]
MPVSNSWWFKFPIAIGLTAAIAASAYGFGIANKAPASKLQAADLLEQGFSLRAAGQLPEALAAFEQAIETKPNYAEAYTAKGALLAKQGKNSEAIAAFGQAIEADPQLAAPYLGWSQVLIQQGKFMEAKVVLSQARSTLKQQSDTQQTRVVNHLMSSF